MQTKPDHPVRQTTSLAATIHPRPPIVLHGTRLSVHSEHPLGAWSRQAQDAEANTLTSFFYTVLVDPITYRMRRLVSGAWCTCCVTYGRTARGRRAVHTRDRDVPKRLGRDDAYAMTMLQFICAYVSCLAPGRQCQQTRRRADVQRKQKLLLKGTISHIRSVGRDLQAQLLFFQWSTEA
jgi:hypothetical protein